MSNQKLNIQETEYLLSQYERGRSTQCIATEMNLNSVTVGNYLRRNGVTARQSGGVLQTTPELVDLAISMRQQDLPWKTISKKIGITTSTLLRHIRRRKDSQCSLTELK
jgi:IS30 family transposase